ncbi:aminoacyl-tRNA hydrolase [Frankia sp. CNm7]|uniref:Peptidyl-tRNA hydrolase n=1 Tax=Frankia nepalensis TaxID=1836974 RepID=A0A937UVQ7_9ACTN|nr:aminoacyl-tRNA hydrolase [Frankia nepalensis]MBL7495988.1 aminoacyl-tRNA hydrolase [Frankia nepalensis]MBL7513317.1 aminoacyl-tRNA hydrolase [Frankia nepalensis]MBL7523619.1 aminoacyl-tRNA hydrolase [Frankia nepalensis]MBL7633465.1 aminoacyl-tRNA hydrolase [Frankia nepalensis]
MAGEDSGAWLVIGLGNPGAEYAGTRHNAGYLVLDALAERHGARLRSHKARADAAQTRLGPASVVLGRTRSYMNVSGPPVASLRAFFKVDPSRVIVVHDELDIPFGAVRLKRGGGDNGHNGLRSITSSLGTREYLRVRFGIGRPPGRMDPADFVLRDFAPAERKELPFLVDRAADAVEALVTEGLEPAQNRFHALV